VTDGGTFPARGDHAERFTALRPLLFTIAYEILGSGTESDDVLQESYLRWAEVDLSTVQDTKAYLAQLVTRQSLNALRAQSRRREDYIGPWLPEPLLLETKDASSDIVLAESVSMAMLVVLETLSPDERAVFVLREVFGFSHHEIAATIGKSPAAVRQMAHRAREHVQSRRKRFEPVDPQLSMELTARFFTAASTGDLDGLIEMLSEDVVWTADSDGKRSAARRPVAGAERVAKLVVGLVRMAGESGRVEPATYNNAPALKLYLGDSFEGTITVEITDGKISHFYAMRNPDKLTGVDIPREITR
jgi:RNA polymerase sigma-70 factor (ECF subfamily)